MKIVVLGGTGFLGRLVVPALQGAGHDVTVVSRRASRGGAHVVGNAATGDLPAAAFAGRDAIVNLVGIKMPTREQSFEVAHVDATANLIDAARRHGIGRFIHVSVVVSRSDPAEPYRDSKWRAEELVKGSGLAWTILRPGVIWGPGDDLIGHLVKMVRSAPVFPVVGRGDSPMQPVHGADVADAIVSALATEDSAGRSYDLVGPETLMLRQMVRRVAKATGLSTWVLPTPFAVHRIFVALMALTPHPLATAAQLRMLRDGMVGDRQPAERDLGFSPRPFAVDGIRPLTHAIPPLLGMSVRPAGGADPVALAPHGDGMRNALLLALISVPLLLGIQAVVDHVWWQMLIWEAPLVGAGLLAVGLPWRRLLTPTVGRVARGVAGAVLLYAIAWGGFEVLARLVPDVSRQRDFMMGWRAGLAPLAAAVMLPLIVVGEELFWRGAVTLPLAGRLGPGVGILLGGFLFAAAHVAAGPPLLWVAALVAGMFWGRMAVRSDELVSPLVAHLLFDLSVVFWWPLAAGG